MKFVRKGFDFEFMILKGELLEFPLRIGLNQLAAIFSRVLRDSTPRFVGPSVGWSALFTFLAFLSFLG